MDNSYQTVVSISTFRKVLYQILGWIQWIAFFTGVLVAGLWSIPTTRSLLISSGWLTPEASIGIIAIFVSVVVLSIRDVADKTESLSDELRESRRMNRNFVRGGVDRVYDVVIPELKGRKSHRKRIEVDILGYTLYSVYHRLRGWHNSGILKNMTLNLHTLSCEFIKSNPALNNDWAKQAEDNIQTIIAFKDEFKDELSKNKTQINLFSYDHLPAVHGFRIGNGTLMMSFAKWRKGQIDDPGETEFEIIHSAQRTKRAQAMQKVFDNWIEAAQSYTPKTKKR